MDTPTADDIRARSPLLKQRYESGGSDEDVFVVVIEDASALVASATGRLIAPVTDGEEVPDGLLGVAKRAIAKWAERVDTAFGVAAAGKAAAGKRLRSISAGPWSEAYFAPGELSLKNGVAVITGDDVLDGMLWALMTDERREEWIFLSTGRQPAADALTEFDYRRGGGGAGLSPRRHGFIGGPDGF